MSPPVEQHDRAAAGQAAVCWLLCLPATEVSHAFSTCFCTITDGEESQPSPAVMLVCVCLRPLPQSVQSGLHVSIPQEGEGGGREGGGGEWGQSHSVLLNRKKGEPSLPPSSSGLGALRAVERLVLPNAIAVDPHSSVCVCVCEGVCV